MLADCVTPIPSPAEAPVAAQADRLWQLPGATLQAELHATLRSRVPAGWRLSGLPAALETNLHARAGSQL